MTRPMRRAVAARSDRVDDGGLEVVARLADRDLDVEIEVAAGEVLAVLGPNGAGKSTLLEIVSGLVVPDAGRVRLGARTLTDTAKSVVVPPHRRGISLLAQDSLLFPHLTVAQNVAFGPRSRGARAAAARTIARDWLAAVDATEFAERKPGQLSGGQAQRVALARALAVDPHLLLLDEPMAALDVAVAPAMRALLRRVLRDHSPTDTRTRSAILVTHDIIDALTLADRLVVIESGRVVESGPVATVLARPRSSFAARIAGVNLIVGTAVAAKHAGSSPDWSSAHRDRFDASAAGALFEQLDIADQPPTGGAAASGARSVARLSGATGGRAVDAGAAGQEMAGGAQVVGAVLADGVEVVGRADGGWASGGRAAAVFSPAAVAVHREVPEGSPRNGFRVLVAELVDRGGIVRVRGAERADGSAGLAADLTPAAVAELGLLPGMWVYFAVKATEVQVYRL
ncbi:sulfate/molybdate ABC transporter ATP-binding protein [Nocardia sp. NPDC052566]|uniref:sulfate/molybdate ABC transporter ATP-binding protein n=1 Tax=Nocardia sp. NPDC052566 TaxID=3364330 RepID=UPI0037CB28BA